MPTAPTKRRLLSEAPSLTYDDQLSRNTGRRSDPTAWRKSQRRQRTLTEESERLADCLEAAGIAARLDGPLVAVIGEVTGVVEFARPYRPIRFIPIVAQQERRPMLNALRYFQRTHPLGKQLRLAVLTIGERVPLGGAIRQALQELHRMISRLASEARARYGVEFVYRGTEFTVDAEKSFHPHANLLYAPTRKLSRAEWSSFLAWMHARVRAHWRDCGRLRKPEEAIKYPFKPADLDPLGRADIVWLYGELSRLKMAQPLGAFAELWRNLDQTGEKIAFIGNGEEGRLERISKQLRERTEGPGMPADTENMLVGRTAPTPRFSPYWEPCSRVRNFTEHPKTKGGQFRLALIRDRQIRARAAWRHNGAPEPETALILARGNCPLGR